MESLRGKRIYQFPQAAYALVHQDMGRFGPLTSAAVEAFLSGQAHRLDMLEPDELKRFLQCAQNRGVEIILPEHLRHVT